MCDLSVILTTPACDCDDTSMGSGQLTCQHRATRQGASGVVLVIRAAHVHTGKVDTRKRLTAVLQRIGARVADD